MGLLGMAVPGGKGRCAGGFLLRHRWVLGLGTVVPPCLFTVIPFIPSKTLSSFPQRCCSSSCPWWAQSRQDSVLAITPSHNLQAQMKYNEARCLACRDSWCHTQMLWVSYTLQILGEKKKRVVFLELPGLCTLGKRVQQCYLQTCDQALGSDQAQICRTPLNGAPFTRKGYSHRQGKGLEILSHNSARSYFISVVFSLPRRQPATKAKLQPLKNSLIKDY